MDRIELDSARRFWGRALAAASGLTAVGLAAPLLATVAPGRQARRAGAPLLLRWDELQPGQLRTLAWRGLPIWLLRRTPAMLQALGQHEQALADPQSQRQALPTPAWARNRWRSRLPELLVLRGVCTHLGCIPRLHSDADGAADGFVCPCHGSRFDLAGRVWRDMPAPDNLVVPPYALRSGGQLLLGGD